jgi:hypothetical protein
LALRNATHLVRWDQSHSFEKAYGKQTDGEARLPREAFLALQRMKSSQIEKSFASMKVLEVYEIPESERQSKDVVQPGETESASLSGCGKAYTQNELEDIHVNDLTDYGESLLGENYT